MHICTFIISFAVACTMQIAILPAWDVFIPIINREGGDPVHDPQPAEK